MLTPTLRTGSELSLGEKTDIIRSMFATQNPGERDNVRKSLTEQYGITEGTITSLIAHETMRRMKNGQLDYIYTEGYTTNPTLSWFLKSWIIGERSRKGHRI